MFFTLFQNHLTNLWFQTTSQNHFQIIQNPPPTNVIPPPPHPTHHHHHHRHRRLLKISSPSTPPQTLPTPSIYQTFYNPPFPPPPNSSRVLYPVASSGRGFIPNHQHPSSDHNLVPNSDAFHPVLPPLTPTTLFASNSDVSGHLGNPSHAQTAAAAANPKVVGPSSVAADNSLKNTRDKNGDDTFVVIRDRKVQVSEGTSLYAQCRSWLKNGLVLEKTATICGSCEVSSKATACIHGRTEK
ncbi:hypothetical protein HanRHA438_Chr01g0027381 [Helianthus annuus]|nr:hypothetical protein HanRHA438_Chr01g0027381 [Helianthus annuus]